MKRCQEFLNIFLPFLQRAQYLFFLSKSTCLFWRNLFTLKFAILHAWKTSNFTGFCSKNATFSLPGTSCPCNLLPMQSTRSRYVQAQPMDCIAEFQSCENGRPASLCNRQVGILWKYFLQMVQLIVGKYFAWELGRSP